MQQQERVETLQMALVGLGKLQSQIQQELNQLRGAPEPKWRMSVAGRAAISRAQKLRWKKYHQERGNVH